MAHGYECVFDLNGVLNQMDIVFSAILIEVYIEIYLKEGILF